MRAQIVNACPALVRLRATADAVPANAMWLVILDRLADCMQTGDLRGRTIVLYGASSPRTLVTRVLVDSGVDAARLAIIAAPEARDTLEISLAPSPTFAPDDPATR